MAKNRQTFQQQLDFAVLSGSNSQALRDIKATAEYKALVAQTATQGIDALLQGGAYGSQSASNAVNRTVAGDALTSLGYVPQKTKGGSFFRNFTKALTIGAAAAAVVFTAGAAASALAPAAAGTAAAAGGTAAAAGTLAATGIPAGGFAAATGVAFTGAGTTASTGLTLAGVASGVRTVASLASGAAAIASVLSKPKAPIALPSTVSVPEAIKPTNVPNPATELPRREAVEQATVQQQVATRSAVVAAAQGRKSTILTSSKGLGKSSPTQIARKTLLGT